MRERADAGGGLGRDHHTNVDVEQGKMTAARPVQTAPVEGPEAVRGLQAADRVTVLAAKAAVAVLAVGAAGFGLWRVRSIVILLLLALTFAAAIRPGVEWLRRHKVPQPASIFAFF